MKRVLFLLSIIIAICALASCSHTHVKGSEYKSNATDHWYPCTYSGCEETFEKAEHSWGQGSVTTQPTASKDGVKTYLCTVCKAMKQVPVKYEPTPTVTAEAWQGAFSMEKFYNVTANITEEIMAEDVTYKTVYDIQGKNTVIYLIITEYQNGKLVNYNAKFQDGNRVWHFIDKNKTIEDVTPVTTVDDVILPTSVLTNYDFQYLSTLFDSFTYNSETKRYEAQDVKADGMRLGYKSISVKFGDGTVTEITAVTDEEAEMTVKVTYSSYGATEPTPPTKQENK